MGMWSVVRNQLEAIQQLESGNQSIWLLYQNEDRKITYNFDCSKNESALLSPFPQGTTVKNLLSPYEEIKLENGPDRKLFIDKSQEKNGCLKKLVLDAWGFKAFVPKSAWKPSPPTLTKFIPGYDARLASTPNLDVELHFSAELDCDLVTDSLIINATTHDHTAAKIDASSVHCEKMTQAESPAYGAYVPSSWRWKATMNNIADGIHTLTLNMSSSAVSDNKNSTGSVDRLMFRVGGEDNPLVFPQSAHSNPDTYSRDPKSKDLKVTHTAALSFHRVD
jgi:alpha-1,3-glucan synthase